MSPEYRTPGVYIQEGALPPSIVPAPTDRPAFIGCTERAVDENGASLTHVPVRITSMLDYQARFGDAPAGATPPLALLPYALQLYFDNGGGPCTIVSIGPFGSVSVQGVLDAIATLEASRDVTLLLFPDALSLGDADYATVVNAALASAARTQDRLVLVDVPGAVKGAHDTIETVRSAFSDRLTNDSDHRRFGAAYFPYLATTIRPRGTSAGPGMVLPPSPAIAGVIVATDAMRGCWKAPANVALADVTAAAVPVRDDQQPDFTHDVAGKSLNLIRDFQGRGTLVWGARTLSGNDADFRYINVRRFVTFVESSIAPALASYVFEPNRAPTWVRVKAEIENFLTGLWRAGALSGAKPQEAWGVRVGLGETMTPDDVANGRMIVEVMLAPVRPAEFIIIHLRQVVAPG